MEHDSVPLRLREVLSYSLLQTELGVLRKQSRFTLGIINMP